MDKIKRFLKTVVSMAKNIKFTVTIKKPFINFFACSFVNYAVIDLTAFIFSPSLSIAAPLNHSAERGRCNPCCSSP